MNKRSIFSENLSSDEINILLEFFPKGVTAFDLEMTGLSPVFDKIIEIAGVKLLPTREVKIFSQLINPLVTIPEHTIKYHGLTNEKLKDEPTLKRPLMDFLEFIDNSPLIAHNALFDASFLFVGVNEFQFSPGLSDIFDSCKFARTLFRGKKEQAPANFKLSTLAEYYKIPLKHHMALDDAMASLRIFAKVLIEFKKDLTKKKIKEHSFLFKINSFKKSSDYFIPKKLAGIKELTQTKREFIIKYKGGSKPGRERNVVPIAILALPQGLVLYSECVESKMNKYFYLKKIQSLKTIA